VPSVAAADVAVAATAAAAVDVAAVAAAADWVARWHCGCRSGYMWMLRKKQSLQKQARNTRQKHRHTNSTNPTRTDRIIVSSQLILSHIDYYTFYFDKCWQIFAEPNPQDRIPIWLNAIMRLLENLYGYICMCLISLEYPMFTIPIRF